MSSAKYVIRTSSYGPMHQTTINMTEEESIASFMEEYGYEPDEFTTVHTDGVFYPQDIQGRIQSGGCGCY